MKYCTECGSEYQDNVTVCADDGNAELVSADELHRRGGITATERDTRKFVRAGTAEDPLSAERFTQALEAEGIPVFARPRRAGSVDSITGGSVSPWWEILVPEEQVERATKRMAEVRAEVDADAEEAGRAAEEEAMSGEAAKVP